MREVWLPVPGYEGIYEVSNCGRVMSIARSLPGGGRRNDKLLNQHDHRQGYKRVDLRKHGFKTKHLVHRLVASAFLGKGEQVNHINGIKFDNHVDNLEWCTPSENVRHAIRTGLR